MPVCTKIKISGILTVALCELGVSAEHAWAARSIYTCAVGGRLMSPYGSINLLHLQSYHNVSVLQYHKQLQIAKPF